MSDSGSPWTAERPTFPEGEAGFFWVRWPDGHLGLAEFGNGWFGEGTDVQFFGEAEAVEVDLTGCLFSPAIPPPEWGLVGALQEIPAIEAGKSTMERFASFEAGIEEGARRAVEIARAYLAGEPRP